MAPVNVAGLKVEEFKSFLKSFDHVFSDCDGVIWHSKPFPESGTFFGLMKKLRKTVHYVSNNSMRTKENYERKFKASGIEDGFDYLTVPSSAIATYLKSENMKKKVYCVTCAETIRVLESNGFECVSGPEEIVDDYTQFVQYLKDDEEIGAVVLDSDFKVNLPKLYKAVTYLNRPEVLFVNGATDRNIPLIPGVTCLGTGVFSDIVAERANRVPIQLGKPGKEFGQFAMKRAGVSDPSRVLFIGDMIEQDICLGKATGFKTLLVLTMYNEEHVKANKTIQPDYIARDLQSMVPLLSAVSQN